MKLIKIKIQQAEGLSENRTLYKQLYKFEKKYAEILYWNPFLNNFIFISIPLFD